MTCQQEIFLYAQVATHDVQKMEDVIDALLAYDIDALLAYDISLVDPCSMSINSYLQLLQPLQLVLEYTWFLYSRDCRQQGATAKCLTAANAFSNALKRYSRAALTELGSGICVNGMLLQSEQLRAQLKPLKKLHDATRASMQV